MIARSVCAVLAVLTCAGSAPAEPPRPPVAFQVTPASRLLTDFKELIRQVGGPARGERAVRRFEEQLKERLGEQGLEGLDINRPLAGYAVLKEKWEDSGFVLVVPVTGEKEFLGLLTRLEVARPVPVKDKPGLYTLQDPLGEEGRLAKGSHLRFVDGWAYLTFNDGEPTAARDLVPVRELIDDTNPSLVTVRVFPARLPEKLLKALLDELDRTVTEMKMAFGGNEPIFNVVVAFADNFPKLARRVVERGVKEADELRVSLGFDPASGEVAAEMTVFPKAGSPLAKSVAARVPTTNRFAGLHSPDAVVSLLTRFPRIKEIRELGASVFETTNNRFQQFVTDFPAALMSVTSEALKGMARTFQATDKELDAAVALHGPNNEGRFTLLLAVSFDDPAALEKALRAAAKDPAFAKEFTLDAVKVSGVSVHQVPLYELFSGDDEEQSETVTRIFGQKAPGYVAIGKDAVYVGFGPEALERVKGAIAAKPGPAPALDVTINLGRLHELLAADGSDTGREFAKQFAKQFGTAKESVGLFRVTVTGGETLRLKLAMNVPTLLRFVAWSIGPLGVEPPR